MKSKKILIVEDEVPMAHALEIKLNKSGFDAKAVYDGLEAVKAIVKEKFDLVLLDLILPKKTGFDVLADLKKKKIKVPVIVLSNLNQEEDVEKVKALGAVEFLIKSNTSLLEVIKNINKFLK